MKDNGSSAGFMHVASLPEWVHHPMAVRKLIADPYTRSELARSGLEELSRNLSPGRCPTCGSGLGAEPPAVSVVDDAMSVTATLHHVDCRRAQWTRTDQGFLGRHLSTTTRLVRMPFGNAARDPFHPTLVVNPSLEQVTLALEEHGRYRATTVASYRPLGLTSPRHGLARSTTPLVTSWVTDEALIVRCGDMYWHFSLTGRDRPLEAEIRDRGEVALAISTALNPAEMENPEPLKRARGENRPIRTAGRDRHDRVHPIA
jgi:hypothetical protein